jgi:hypothetical protein
LIDSEAVVAPLPGIHTTTVTSTNAKEVKTMAYTTPMIEKIADYSEATRGVWFGAWRDILKAKAPFYFDAKL